MANDLWWKGGLMGIAATTVLGGGWFLYTQSIKKTEDKVVEQCNSTKLEQELAAAKELASKESARADAVQSLLADQQAQLKNQSEFIARVRTQLDKLPDDKIGERTKEFIKVLNGRVVE